MRKFRIASRRPERHGVQLNSTWPWTLNYVNPADDPRKSRLGHDLAPGGGREEVPFTRAFHALPCPKAPPS